MVTEIKNSAQYLSAMQTIDVLMRKGEANLTAGEMAELAHLAKMAERWEDTNDPLEPQTINGMLALKMFEKRIKQKELAAMLGITATRLSEVMNGKRRVNMEMAKMLYHKLGIPADFLLTHC